MPALEVTESLCPGSESKGKAWSSGHLKLGPPRSLPGRGSHPAKAQQRCHTLEKKRKKKKKGSHQQVERVSNSCAESRRAAEAAAGAGWRPPGDGRAGRGHPGPPGAFPGFQSRVGMRHWACCVCGVRTGSPRGRADWQGCAASPPGPHPGSATEGPPASAGQPPFLNPGSSSVSWGNGHPPCCRANHCRPGC